MRIFPFALLATAFLAAGCAECTKLGCIGGINLDLTGPDGEPIEDAAGTVTMDGTAVDFDCADEAGADFECTQGLVTIMVDGGETAEFTLVGADGTQEVSGELDLDFVEDYPNGEDCPAQCKSSSHEVTLKESQDVG